MVTIIKSSPWYSDFHILYTSILFKIIQVSGKQFFIHRWAADAGLIQQEICFGTVIDRVFADEVAQDTRVGVSTALKKAG